MVAIVFINVKVRSAQIYYEQCNNLYEQYLRNIIAQEIAHNTI